MADPEKMTHWMSKHSLGLKTVTFLLPFGLLITAFGCHCFAQTKADIRLASIINVGRNTQVSKGRDDQFHWEVVLAADPKNSNNLIACSIVGEEQSPQQAPSVVIYASFDRGKTWQETLNITGGEMTIDPTCTYGADGMTYAVAMPVSTGRLAFYKSSDSGKTWSEVDLQIVTSRDRPFLVVDNTASTFRGRIYMNALSYIPSANKEDAFVGTFALWRFPDNRESLLGPTRLVPTKADHSIGSMGNGVVLSDGTFVAITYELNNPGIPFHAKPFQSIGRVIAVISKDGGESFLPTATIGEWYYERDQVGVSSPVPALAVDRSSGPFKDFLYAVWPDLRYGRSTVLVSHSSDKGRTWSRAIPVSDNIHNADTFYGDFMPSVAVNSSGVVAVMWYDRRESRDDPSYWPRLSVSFDGGETFLPSTKVSEAPQRLQIPKLALTETRSSQGFFTFGVNERLLTGGDTSGLTSDRDGVFHALWVDNRTGVPQVWTAPVSVQGKAIRNGSNDLAEMSDATQKAFLLFGRPIYDRASHTVTVDAVLENTSKEPLRGPIKVRLLTLDSRLGRISVANSNNHLTKAGAVWDFTEALDNGVLNAGSRSRPKRLEFRLIETPKTNRPYQDLLQMVEVRAKILVSR